MNDEDGDEIGTWNESTTDPIIYFYTKKELNNLIKLIRAFS